MAKVNITGSDEDLHEFYPTPISYVRSCLSFMPELTRLPRVLDAGCGGGVWGEGLRELYPGAGLAGIDIRNVRKHDAYNLWLANTSYFTKRWHDLDAVIGNPPFSIATQWILHSLAQLREGGYLVLLLRLAFLEGERRATALYSKGIKPIRLAVYSKRPSFSNDGGTDKTAYMAVVWQKGNLYAKCDTSIVLPNFDVV